VPTNGNKVLAMQGVLPVLAQEEVDGSAVLAHTSELALPGDEPMPSHQAWPSNRWQGAIRFPETRVS
jgi:hypothetical protein